MQMKGQRFHFNELGIENEELRNGLLTGNANSTFTVKVSSIFKKDDKECLIQGSTLDKELLQPIPPLFNLVSDDIKKLKTCITDMNDGFVTMIEYLVIEPVLNWFGEPIDSYFRIVDISI